VWQRPESLTWSALSLGSVRESNIVAAKAVADAVRTSLGPRGMDKMVPPARLTLRGLRGEGRIRPAQGDLFAAPWSSPLTMPLPCPAAQISSPKGEVVITNDGATILKQMQVAHPTAKMLVDLSKSQDVEAGDGTTTVTVIAGSLLNQAQILLEKGIHPTVISESFLLAARKSEEILKVRPNAASSLPPQPAPSRHSSSPPAAAQALPPQLKPSRLG
jgi:T-complex protein 1 subunit delta